MPRSRKRRRFLELLSVGLLGTAAGCTDSSSGPAGGDAAAGFGGAGDASGEVGVTAGGAQDVGAFRSNVENGYLPVPQSLSYEGLFSEYYFDTGGSGSCQSLFCAAYSPAVSPDPLSSETERYFTVGLNSGMDQSDFERPPVNLVVVLDVSNSMDSSIREYYYDGETGGTAGGDGERGPSGGGEREPSGEGGTRQKIAVARDALLALVDQLDPRDRLGIVLFDDRATVHHPTERLGDGEQTELRERVREIAPDGSTNVDAGVRTGFAQLRQFREGDGSGGSEDGGGSDGSAGSEAADGAGAYENRIVVVTDAQPNVGDTSAHGLRGTLESAADDGLYTSFVGVGVDFNPELVDRITSIRGANYYTARSARAFERRMSEEFAFMVTPLAFDLSVELDSAGADIVDVYGSSVDDAATASLFSVPTLFPAPREDGKTRGGVVLVEVDGAAGAEPPTLTASWETTDGEQRSQTSTVQFPEGTGEEYANSGVRKAVLLARYGALLRDWMVHERDRELVEGVEGVEPAPESALGRWEQPSEDLVCSSRPRERIRTFREQFRTEVDALADEDLRQELDVMESILAASAPAGSESAGAPDDATNETSDADDGASEGGTATANAGTGWFGRRGSVWHGVRS